jgi:hypothetical protein
VRQFFVVALQNWKEQAVVYFYRPAINAPNGWALTARYSDAFHFETREKAESAVLLDSVTFPERIKKYEVVAVTRVVEDAALVDTFRRG